LAACDAGAKPAPPAPLVKKTSSEPAKQQVSTAGFDLAYLPADSDVVIHVDLTRLRQSKLWETYKEDAAKLIAPAFVGCNYTPTSDATSVDAGIPITSKVNVLVFRGIDREKAFKCFRDHGDVVAATSATGMIRDIAFVDAHTMVVRSSPVATKQTMQDALKETADAPLRKNAEFMAAIASSKKSAGVVAVSRPGSVPLATQMNPSGIKLGYFAGTLDLDAQLAVHYSMTVGSAAEATALVSTMKAQVESPSVKQMFDRIETKAQDSTVTLDFVMGETKLATMSSMVRALVPAP
jgi:hypothetical protein